MTRAPLAAVATLIITAAATLATAAPANAMAITAGYMITSGGRWCTVSLPDPMTPNIVYTASHCYRDGITEVSLGDIKIGEFIPEIRNTELDVIAIRLHSGMPSEYSLMSREPLLNPWVPNEGNEVCKYGATTQETCGTILSVSRDRNSFTVEMTADHGDSGAPIYGRLEPGADGVHIVGTVISEDPSTPGVITCTNISAINNFLSNTWGSSWDMD